MKPIVIIATAIVCSITILSSLPDADAKTWKVHLKEMPKHWESHFGDIYTDGAKYWEKRIPGTYFVEETQREKADFVVQWSSQFQGSKLGYYTPSSNNDFGRPYIAITLGYMDDESVSFQDRKFNLVDAEYAKLITIHELGHAIGFHHSDDPDDIMYPTIYNYDNWLYEKEFQSMKISTQFNSKSVVTQFNSKSIEIQQESNSKVEEVKEYVYSKQDLLLSKHYESQDAQEELNKAMESLDEAKNYLGQAEWTQNEGASFLSTSDYEEAYYKYLHSVGMAKKVWDPIIEINKAIKSADELETEYQEIIQSEKTSESNQIEKKNEKTCFLFWCW
jgi:hypothetical protein